MEAWNTYNINSTDRHEHIQRAASRFVHNDYRHKTSVCNLIDILDWDHIHTMRLVSHLTMFYEKHYYLVIIDIPQLVSPVTFIGKHDHQMKYAIAVATIDSYKLSFYPRSTRFCHQLPSAAGLAGFWDEVTNWVQDAVINQHCFYGTIILFYYVVFLLFFFAPIPVTARKYQNPNVA